MVVVNHLQSQHIEQLHQLYLQEWWTCDRSLEQTRRCVAGSQLCIGVIDRMNQLCGFARVLTDYCIKALIFDVIVAKENRRSGIGNLLMRSITQHPDLRAVKHFELYCLEEMETFYQNHNFTLTVGGIHLMRHIARH